MNKALKNHLANMVRKLFNRRDLKPLEDQVKALRTKQSEMDKKLDSVSLENQLDKYTIKYNLDKKVKNKK